MLQVKRILVGIVGTNCYIVYDKDTKEAVVIDPGAEEERIISFIEEEGLKPEAILLTHGHFDHILAVPALREKYKIPLYAAKEEREMLGDGELNLSGRDPEDSVEIKERSWSFLEGNGKSSQVRDTLRALSATFWQEKFPIFSVAIHSFWSPTEERIYLAEVRRTLSKVYEKSSFCFRMIPWFFRGMRKAQQYGMKRAIIRLISLSKPYQGCKKSN